VNLRIDPGVLRWQKRQSTIASITDWVLRSGLGVRALKNARKRVWAKSKKHGQKGENVADRAILAILLGCGLRRAEVAKLPVRDIQQREEHWALVDLMGKGRHIRTVPVPDWVKAALDEWTKAAGVGDGRVFRCVSRKGSVWGNGITEKVIWHIVKASARHVGIQKLAPHDCRRSCARLCHAAGGELEQIQFLLGHVSVETTERYLGCKQRLRQAVNDQIGLEP
jgi:site-specific recombinase XerD